MITILYLVLLFSFLILEKIISNTAQYRGLLLAIGVVILGIIFNPKFIWLAIIIAGQNVGRLIINELRLLKLTSLKERLASVLELQARFK